jgi:hypothetical protein
MSRSLSEHGVSKKHLGTPTLLDGRPRHRDLNSNPSEVPKAICDLILLPSCGRISPTMRQAKDQQIPIAPNNHTPYDIIQRTVQRIFSMKLGLMSLGDLIRDPITGTMMDAGKRHRMMIDAAIADDYREAFAAAGHPHLPEVGACWHGWVDRTSQNAHVRFEPRYRAYHAFTQKVMKSVNPNPPSYLTAPFDYDNLRKHGPAIVGSPAEFVDRISHLQEILGTDVNLVKMDMGDVPPEEYLEMIELLASDVVPKLAMTSQSSIAVATSE